MGLQSCKSINLGNFETPLWESQDKMTFGCGHVAMHKKYMGEGVGFPQVRAVVSLVNPCLPMVCLWTKSAPTMH
jgi:hypothetical protein